MGMLSLGLVPFSNMKSSSRERAFMQAKRMNTTDHPKIGNTRLATNKPIIDAIAVPINSKEYTFDPNLEEKIKL